MRFATVVWPEELCDAVLCVYKLLMCPTATYKWYKFKQNMYSVILLRALSLSISLALSFSPRNE